jgi:regulator of sigma D
LPFISEINMLRDLPDDVHYNLLKEYLPRQKMWFKYISRIKKEDVNIVNNIMEFYDCSEDEAIDYLELLPKDMIKDIEKFYDAGGKVSSRKR